MQIKGSIFMFTGIWHRGYHIRNKSKNLDNGFDCHLVTPSFAIYGNYLLFILTSTLLSIATICLSVLLDCKLTSKLGKETMVIYAFHPFFIGVFGFYGLSIFHGLISSVLVLFITCLMIPALKNMLLMSLVKSVNK